MPALSEFLDVHENVRRSGDGFVMRCRAHEDRSNSLSAKQADGKILIHCFAGCETDAVVAAIGWTLKDLFLNPKPAGVRLVRHSRSSSTRYEIRAADGQLVAIHERIPTSDGKKYLWRRPDGSLGLGDQSVHGVPLYRSQDASNWNLDLPVVLTEGEPAADAVIAAGIQAVGTVCGAAAIPSLEALAILAGCDVVLWPDADDAGRAHMRRIATAVAGSAAGIRLVDWPDAPDKGDAADTTPELVRQLVATARPLSPTTDKPVPSSLAGVLDAIREHLCRFVSFSDPAQAVTITLWIAHAHGYDKADASPILWIRSVAPESGKTRLLETMEPLVPRPWSDIRPSEAVLYRRTHRDHPTVLLDEIDAVFKDRSTQFEGLRAYLNAGNRRGVTVSRWNTARNDLDSFEIYTPKAIAGLGSVPDTVATRAIPIVMRRRTKTERVERLRSRRARELGHPLRDALAAHVASLNTLTLPDDALPEELSDRQQDSWEPLLAIADAAGGAWPEQARLAAIGLHIGADVTDEQDYGIRLLADTRAVFTQSGDEWLKTSDLIHELANVEESPWGDIRDKPISAHYLAKLLRGFGIKPTHKRVGSDTQRGYGAHQFADAWLRYLPLSSGTSGTSGTSDTPNTDAGSHVPVVPVNGGMPSLTLGLEAEPP